MKGQQAVGAMREAVVLDLGDVARQAQRLLDAAKDRARRVLAAAELRAKQLTHNAHEQGYEKGFEKGYQEGKAKGHAEGHQAGHAEAFKKASAELETVRTAWIEASRQWDAQRREMERQARSAVLEIALKMAQKVIHRMIEVDERVVVDQLSAALSTVLRPTNVTVAIHPDDRPAVDRAMPGLLSRLEQIRGMNLVETSEITRGGCVVSYGQGRVDATIETQLQRLVELMLAENGSRKPQSVENIRATQTPDTSSTQGTSAREDGNGDCDAEQP